MKPIYAVLPFLMIFLLIGISNAQTLPSVLPSGTVIGQDIIIGSWANVTFSNVQQMVNLTESNYPNLVYNGNQANFEFSYGNGTVIPAWIESNTSGVLTIWLNITNSTNNVYLDFFSSTTNTLSNSGTNGIGEAPELSPSYAEYDDGAEVFPNYWNFAGTTLPSGLSTFLNNGSITVNNSITLNPTTGATDVYSATPITTPLIVEADALSYSYSDVAVFFSQDDINSTPSSGANIYNGYLGGYGSGTTLDVWEDFNGSYKYLSSGVSSSYPSIISLLWGGTGNIAVTSNYTNILKNINSNFTVGSGYLIGLTSYNKGTPSYATYQWLRTRAYPPNGIMPSVSFGSLSYSSSINATYPPITYYNGTPSTIIFNITSNPSNLTFSLWLNINDTGFSLINSSNATLSNSQTNIGIYQYVLNSTQTPQSLSYIYDILPATSISSASGGNSTNIYEALVIGLGLMAFIFLYLGYQGRDNKVFSFLFIVIGFLTMYGMATSMASYTLGYTVPAANVMPYYNSAIHSLANMIYAYSYMVVVALLIYISIFVILYIKDMLMAAKRKRAVKLNYNAEV